MQAGLEVWDENSNQIISITNRLTRIVGQFYTGTSPGSVVVPKEAVEEIWFAPVNFEGGALNNPPTFTVSGNVLSWTWNWTQPDVSPASMLRATVLYGVY